MRLSTKIYQPDGAGTNSRVKDIVLIHGTGACADMWNPQIKTLVERGYRCIVPDLRGHGESHEPEESTDLEVHIADVMETLNGLDVAFPAIWAGHSLGSIISLVVAARNPELVERIMAVSMPGRVPKPTAHVFRWFLGWPYKSLKASKLHKNFAWRERVLIDTNHFTLNEIVRNFATMDFVTNVPAAACTVHFATGRLDPIAPWQHAKKMSELLPHATFTLIDWAGHNPMDSQPKVFNEWFFQRFEQDVPQRVATSN